MKFIPLPGQYFQLHDQCPRFWSSVDWETLLQWKLILDALHLRFLAASWSHNGQRKFCHCFQAIALIRMSQYNLPTYLKSTIPTYDFTLYPLTFSKRHKSPSFLLFFYFSYSTTTKKEYGPAYM